jgi:hypothetical protein
MLSSRNRRKRSTAALSALLVPTVALVAACGSGTPEPSRPEPARQPLAPPVLPFDAYRFTVDDLAVITAGEDALMRRCMQRQGYDWSKPERSPAAVLHRRVETDGNARRYGLADEQTARRHGYHVPDEPRELRAQTAQRAWRGSLTTAENKALFGSGGCADAAAARLRDSGGTPGAAWFTSYDFDSVDASATEPSVRSAMEQWRTCMKKQGFDYDNPSAAIGDPHWNLDAPKVSSRETAVATADVRCKAETDLIAVRAAAEKRFQEDLIARHSEKFAGLKRGLDRYLRNAENALSGD